MNRKPYFVTWQRQGMTSKVFESHNPVDCYIYANQHIRHDGITERIEIRDYTGALECLYDKSWTATH